MTIDISPVETIRKLLSVDVRVRQRRMKLLTIQVSFEDLILVVTFGNLAIGMRGDKGSSQYGQSKLDGGLKDHLGLIECAGMSGSRCCCGDRRLDRAETERMLSRDSRGFVQSKWPKCLSTSTEKR